MRVALRVDAAPHIGSGHLMRCLTLADTLRTRGADAHFVCRPLSPATKALLEAHGHALHELPPADGAPPETGAPPHGSWLGTSQAADAAASEAVLAVLRPDWLVLDHYAIDARWERRMRPQVGRILAIDDLADRQHDCDLLLDQNYHADAQSRYDGRLPAPCSRLLGPRHALLRPEFATARARRRQRDGHVRRVLVSLGGIDELNVSERALQAALRLEPACAVDVVVGADSRHRGELATRCTAHPRATLHVQTERMAELIDAADLAVGASGSSTWERMCLGLPTLLLAIADNQLPVLTSLCEDGLALGSVDGASIGVDALHAMLQSLTLAPEFLLGLSRRGAALVDGQGARRVVDVMLPQPIALRSAVAADCADLHAWRNHPEVRAQSHDTREITLDEHRRWFERARADPALALLVGSDAQGPVGVVRFDLREHDATVSVYLVPTRIGHGLGAPLLRVASDWVREHKPHVERVLAEVRPGNLASVTAFEQAGYAPDHQVLFVRLRDLPR